MAPDGLGKFGYLVECLEEHTAEPTTARWAACRVAAGGPEFEDLAEGTTEGSELSGCRVFHFPVLCGSLASTAQRLSGGKVVHIRQTEYFCVLQVE
jgi:hypothetical protein